MAHRETSTLVEDCLSKVRGESVAVCRARSSPRGLSTSVEAVFSSSYNHSQVLCPPAINAESDNSRFFNIYIKPPSCETFSLSVSEIFPLSVVASNTVLDVKELVKDKVAISVNQMHLRLFNKDLDDSITLSEAGIQEGSTLIVLSRLNWKEESVIGRREILKIPFSGFAPGYDYDFTKLSDDGKTYMRGGYRYNRPYGWKRTAFKVIGKYGDDTWLGPRGIRTGSAEGEWAVAYHGTNQSKPDCVGKIVNEGFRSGPRQAYGPGVYLSPSLPMVAKHYADTVTKNGKKHKFVFQTRVDPTRIRVVANAKDGADYWVVPESAVRPYGLLTQRI